MQREAMNKLKKQLQEKSSADGNKTEEQKYVKPPQNGTTKGRDIKSNEPKQADIKQLPHTPGVVLKFYCKGSGLTKRELRVCGSIFVCTVCSRDFTFFAFHSW